MNKRQLFSITSGSLKGGQTNMGPIMEVTDRKGKASVQLRDYRGGGVWTGEGLVHQPTFSASRPRAGITVGDILAQVSYMPLARHLRKYVHAVRVHYQNKTGTKFAVHEEARGGKPAALPITMKPGFTIMKVYFQDRPASDARVMLIKNGLPVEDFLAMPDGAYRRGKFSKTTVTENAVMFQSEGADGKTTKLAVIRSKDGNLHVVSAARMAALVA